MGSAKSSHHGHHPGGESIEDMSRLPSIRVALLVLCLATIPAPTPATAADLTAENVLRSIGRAQRFLLGMQRPDGRWSSRVRRQNDVGVTSLVLLALLNSGKPMLAVGMVRWLWAVQQIVTHVPVRNA